MSKKIIECIEKHLNEKTEQIEKNKKHIDEVKFHEDGIVSDNDYYIGKKDGLQEGYQSSFKLYREIINILNEEVK